YSSLSFLHPQVLQCSRFYHRCLAMPFFFCLLPPPLRSTLFPYTTLFRSPFFGWKNLRLVPKSLLLHSISSCPEEEGVSKCKANRSEEHTSELQSRFDLVCRLLLEKKKKR